MRGKTNQVESFWREIGNWCRSVFILVDLSALKINKQIYIYYNIKQTMLEWKKEP